MELLGQKLNKSRVFLEDSLNLKVYTHDCKNKYARRSLIVV
jgi:hypothetical protein